jgi:hypothetical protein
MAMFSALGLSPPTNHPPAITFSSVALSNFGGGRNYKRRLLHNHFLSGEVTEKQKCDRWFFKLLCEKLPRLFPRPLLATPRGKFTAK